jgi:chromosome segregation ATPase
VKISKFNQTLTVDPLTLIEHKEELLQEILHANEECREKIKRARTKLDHAVIRKLKEALKYKDQVSAIRSSHEDFLEAEIRLLEAESDVAGLEERNAEIVRQQNEEQERVRVMEQETRVAKDIARKAQHVVMELFSDPEVEAHREQLTTFSNGYTMETLEIEIAAEESKLDFIHANNPNAIRDFEKRQGEVNRLKAKIEESTERLERITRKIAKTRQKWEPELDRLIGAISDAFSYNFEQIGCAGEVSVHKDDDFDLWAIQIKVKFR